MLGPTLVQEGMLLRLEDASGRRLPTAEEEADAAVAERAATRAALTEERAAREAAERTLHATQDELAHARAELARLREGAVKAHDQAPGICGASAVMHSQDGESGCDSPRSSRFGR